MENPMKYLLLFVFLTSCSASYDPCQKYIDDYQYYKDTNSRKAAQAQLDALNCLL